MSKPNLALSLLFLSLAHLVTGFGTHNLHLVHLVLQKMLFVPLLGAAALLSARGSLGVTLYLAGLLLWHGRGWSDLPMQRAEWTGEAVSFLITGLAATWFFARLRQDHRQSLVALAECLDLREKETGRHSQRVCDYSLRLAREMGVRSAQLEVAALLHDLGKIGIPDSILLKPDSLEASEWEVMRQHPDLGARLVGRVRFLQPAAGCIRSHHEKFDGSGYPAGLRGQAIPLEARIFALADVLDALTSPRPYRQPMTLEQAAAHIVGESGRHFDPAVVDAFQRIPLQDWADLAAGTGLVVQAR